MLVLATIGFVTAVAVAVVLLVSERKHAARVRSLTRERDALAAERDTAEIVAERMRRAVDALPLGVLLCDADRAVVYRNRAARRYTSGRRSEAMVGAAIDELLAGALGGVVVRRTLEQYGPPHRTLVVSAWPLRRDGADVVDAETADAIDNAVVATDDDEGPAVRTADDVLGAVVLIDDVSERRRLEAVRRDFVANISHELKTPVGALSLLAETMLDERDDEVLGRLAERILSEALRVGRTIDDLLELSRIEIDETTEHEPVRVARVIAEALERIRPAAEQHDITLTASPVDAGVVVLGDRRQLVSALYNLLDNAVKYSERGSAVDVTTDATDDSVEVGVADHGIGIPARDLDRIFERFYRVDRARSRDTGGTGLGLAIVRHVAANHDGDVCVDSRQGEGSTFTLTLPRHHPVEVRTTG